MGVIMGHAVITQIEHCRWGHTGGSVSSEEHARPLFPRPSQVPLNTPSPPVFRVPPAPPLSLSLVHFPWAHVSFIPGLASSAYAADV